MIGSNRGPRPRQSEVFKKSVTWLVVVPGKINVGRLVSFIGCLLNKEVIENSLKEYRIEGLMSVRVKQTEAQYIDEVKERILSLHRNFQV